MKFYDRKSEFRVLDRVKENFRIAIIGRRRIGKTALVENFYGKKCITLFVSAEKAEKEIVGGWVKEYSGYNVPNVSNFKDFFDFVFVHLKEKVIFIDELQNFLKVNKSAVFDLQRAIDKHKPKLVVSGSIISVMKRIVEDYKSPLYGRFDFIIKLNELSFNTVYEICKDMRVPIEEAFKIYSVFGGIPKYYELVEKTRFFEFNQLVIDSFVVYPRPLYEEVRTMLKEEFGKEFKTFFSILSAISQGNNRHSEIAGFLGKKQTEITKYLSMLKDDFGLIERNTPLFEGKKGVYAIRNNLFWFWFGIVWKYNELIETLQERKLTEIIKSNLGKHVSLTFEKTIIELISSKVLFPSRDFSKIGKQWGKFRDETGTHTFEIDIIAVNEEKNEVLFGECKWQRGVNAKKIAKELEEKSKHVKWNETNRVEIFAVFAKSFSKKIDSFEGKEVKCFDLNDFEKALKKK